MSLYDRSVLDLAAAIRHRAISSVELLEAHIARIEAVNPAINALCAERFSEARREAEAADTISPGADRPLHGIPCTIKDFVAVAGMPQTAGLLARKGARATADAEVVRRLKRAGAIVVGISNVPEGGLWVEAVNRVYGRTNNPWDLSRTSGGSSGGEAALVASGAIPFGIGTDIGGSIRIPSGMCGCVGHKPTGRLVPNSGIWPGLSGPRSAYHVAGPIGRTVEDLHEILRVIAGPDGVDEVVREYPVGELGAVPIERVQVFPLHRLGRWQVTPPMGDAIERTARELGRRGATIAPLPSSVRLDHPVSLWARALGSSPGDGYPELLGNGTPISVGRELAKLALGRSAHTFPALFVAAINAVAGGAIHSDTIEADLERVRAPLEAALGDDGVLLHVPYLRVAPKHDQALLHPFDAVSTCLFNVLELPGTVVPVGFWEGLPVAVQVVGKRGNDALTLTVAREIERALGGWQRANPAVAGGRSDVAA